MNYRQTYRTDLYSIKIKIYNNLFALIILHNIVYIDNLCVCACVNPCVIACQKACEKKLSRCSVYI